MVIAARRPGLSAHQIKTHDGIGRKGSPEGAQISDDLRLGTDHFIRLRRRAAGLTLASMASFGMVAAYQFGLIRKVPEPGLPGLDADRVDASSEAYAMGKTPDAALGLLSAAVTLALIGRGGRNRAAIAPWVALATAAKVAVDAAGGLVLTAEQGTKHRKFCSWCLAATATALASVPVVLPEARAAWKQLRSK